MKIPEEKYVVIGGQYQSYDYGIYDSLLAAKRAATAHAEYWDNWQGWHTPCVYRLEDCRKVNNFYGSVYDPVAPCEYWAKKDGKWHHYDAYGYEIDA